MHALPKTAWNQAPEKAQKSVTPIDGGHPPPFFKCTDDVSGHACRCHLQRVILVCDECGAYESWSDVREPYVEFFHPCQLCEGIDIGPLETFGGGVCRCRSQTFGACDAGNDGDASGAVGIAEIAECFAHHLRKAEGVRHQCAVFDGRFKLRVLVSAAGTVEVEVHATHFVNEGSKVFWCVWASNVNGTREYMLWVNSLQAFKCFGAATCHADGPALAEESEGHAASDAGRGTHDDSSFGVHVAVVLSERYVRGRFYESAYDFATFLPFLLAKVR